jgi:hypothetical protein
MSLQFRKADMSRALVSMIICAILVMITPATAKEISLCDIGYLNCQVNCSYNTSYDVTHMACDALCTIGWAWCVVYLEATGFIE